MEIHEHSYNWARPLDKRTKPITRIILHHAAAKSCTPEQIHSWHLEFGWCGFGYHYLVRKSGDVYKGRPDDCIGAHAGNNNGDSIGICFEGNFESEQMPDEQKNAGKELVAMLKEKYSINKVQRHSDVNATACPGKYFPFDFIADSTKEVVYTARFPVIKKGDTGVDVNVLQKMLIGSGYSCGDTGVDGSFGTKTRAGVIAFQIDHEIEVDGVVGKQTWYELFNKEM